MATKRIEALTPAQEARLAEFRDEWLAVGLSTASADRAGAQAGVAQAYRRAGLEPPRIHVWLDSPMRGAIGAAMLTTLPTKVRDQVGDQVGDQVRGQVWDQVRGQVWRAVYGQHDAGWLAFYDYFGRAVGLQSPELLDGLMAAARASGWWWPFRGAVVLTERPVLLRRDAENRLHAETGPAIAYPDGFGVWSWHGVRVERDVIETPVEQLQLARVRDEPNAEVRRVLLERFGHDRFVRESGAKLVHRDDFGKLWQAPLPGDEPLVMVEVVNATPEPDGSFHDYWIRVPPTVKTAHEAVAWTFGQDAAEYAPAVQT